MLVLSAEGGSELRNLKWVYGEGETGAAESRTAGLGVPMLGTGAEMSTGK